jgi:hypothetical protein
MAWVSLVIYFSDYQKNIQARKWGAPVKGSPGIPTSNRVVLPVEYLV